MKLVKEAKAIKKAKKEYEYLLRTGVIFTQTFNQFWDMFKQKFLRKN